MSRYSPTRYGKTCARCTAAITVRPGEKQLCADCARAEAAAREDRRR